MQSYSDVVIDATGRPSPAAITVYLTGTTTKATIYSNNTGTVLANPMTTDGFGRFEFYAANGRYDLAVVTGAGAYQVSDVLLFDGIVSGAVVTVPFSATPTFDATSGSLFKITLTGDVTASTFTGTGGLGLQPITFMIIQDGTGGHTFAWPANVVGGMSISGTAGAVNVQTGVFDGTNLYMLPGSFSA
jgi:hypothetical protein